LVWEYEVEALLGLRLVADEEFTPLSAPGRTIDLSFGVGLTPDTPNLQFSVGLPFRTTLWGPRPKKLNTK